MREMHRAGSGSMPFLALIKNIITNARPAAIHGGVTRRCT